MLSTTSTEAACACFPGRRLLALSTHCYCWSRWQIISGSPASIGTPFILEAFSLSRRGTWKFFLGLLLCTYVLEGRIVGAWSWVGEGGVEVDGSLGARVEGVVGVG